MEVGGWQNHGNSEVLSGETVIRAFEIAAETGHDDILAWHCCCHACQTKHPEVQLAIRALLDKGELVSSGIAPECLPLELARVRAAMPALSNRLPSDPPCSAARR